MLSLPDHDDHIHVGFRPLYGANAKLGQQLKSRAEAEPVDRADRPLGQDRQPDGADQAVEVRAEGAQAGQQGPRRRIACSASSSSSSPGRSGPPDGRYVVRGHAGELEHVLVVATLGAPQRRWLRGRRPRAGLPRPRAGHHRRVTLVSAQPFADEDAAERWLRADGRGRGAGGGGHAQPRAAHAARRDGRSARARGAPRAGARRARGLRRGRAGRRRALGAGARAPARAPRTRRDAALRPQERLGALLGGRDVVLACEELALRARQDVDAGRRREAALQLAWP